MSKRYNLSLSAEELLVFGALTSYSVAALDKDEEAQAGMFLTLTIFKPFSTTTFAQNTQMPFCNQRKHKSKPFNSLLLIKLI